MSCKLQQRTPRTKRAQVKAKEAKKWWSRNNELGSQSLTDLNQQDELFIWLDRSKMFHVEK
jgi:hypothetical protein